MRGAQASLSVFTNGQAAAAAAAAVEELTSTSLSMVPSHISDSDMHAAAVCADADSAVYVADLSHVTRQLREFCTLLPGVMPYYAVKCNPDPVLISFLARLGVAFDCASSHEISIVSAALADSTAADRIIFANPCKAVQSLLHARDVGVQLMTFDSIDELFKIARHFASAQLLLRIAVEDSHSKCPLSSKFGARSNEVQRILEVVKSLNLNLVGVAFHVGSGCTSVMSYVEALKEAQRVFDNALAAGLPPLEILDIGGGFPGHDGEAPITFRQIASVIRSHVKSLFGDHVRIIAEPGRYIATGAYSLAAKVVLVSEQRERRHYYLSEGVFGSFRDAWLLNVEYPAKVLFGNPGNHNTSVRLSNLYGPSRDPIDVIARDIELPILHIGAWLLFPNMGAYTMSLSTKRCGVERYKTLYYYRVPTDDDHGSTGSYPSFTQPKEISSVV